MERGGQYVDSDEEDGYESPDAKRRGASVDDFLKGSELGKPVSGTQASRGPEAPGRDKDGTMPGPGDNRSLGNVALTVAGVFVTSSGGSFRSVVWALKAASPATLSHGPGLFPVAQSPPGGSDPPGTEQAQPPGPGPAPAWLCVSTWCPLSS